MQKSRVNIMMPSLFWINSNIKFRKKFNLVIGWPCIDHLLWTRHWLWLGGKWRRKLVSGFALPIVSAGCKELYSRMIPAVRAVRRLLWEHMDRQAAQVWGVTSGNLSRRVLMYILKHKFKRARRREKEERCPSLGKSNWVSLAYLDSSK